jgi:hypothetical protein
MPRAAASKIAMFRCSPCHGFLGVGSLHARSGKARTRNNAISYLVVTPSLRNLPGICLSLTEATRTEERFAIRCAARRTALVPRQLRLLVSGILRSTRMRGWMVRMRNTSRGIAPRGLLNRVMPASSRVLPSKAANPILFERTSSPNTRLFRKCFRFIRQLRLCYLSVRLAI